jgi:hypothetical protein
MLLCYVAFVGLFVCGVRILSRYYGEDFMVHRLAALGHHSSQVHSPLRALHLFV